MYTFYLKYLIHVSSLSTNEHIKKILLAPSALTEAIHIFFKPCHSKILIFHAKNGIWGKYLYVLKSYFIYTFFRRKSYFIWRKIILYLEIKQWQHWALGLMHGGCSYSCNIPDVITLSQVHTI